MKILSASDIHRVDQATVEQQKIRSIDLMERAAQGLFDQIVTDFPSPDSSFAILCGSGNNGGDGLALSRMLHAAGRLVRVLLYPSNRYSEDNVKNQQFLQDIGLATATISDELTFVEHEVIVDALFGIGLSRPLPENYSTLISSINSKSNKVVAIDIPSGLYADKPSNHQEPIIQADITYTFHSPKVALLQPENSRYIGKLKILDLALEPSALTAVQSNYFFTTGAYIKNCSSMPSHFSHKGTFGHALIIGGSYGKVGALHLSAKAALRTGCGLVTAYAPGCANLILQTTFPEAMLRTDSSPNYLAQFPDAMDSYQAIGIGMGMGQHPDTAKALLQFIAQFVRKNKAPKLVLDADALNILATHKEGLDQLPAETILTPHPKELQRLIGNWNDDWEKMAKVREFTTKHRVVVLIKGAYTAVVLPDGDIYFNSTGNWGMATGGSGDVLTGVITSLLAQGYSCRHAAIMGVYLHGLAGDLAAQQTHPKSLIASDIINSMADAWRIVLPVTDL